jgi:hypothetical protein
VRQGALPSKSQRDVCHEVELNEAAQRLVVTASGSAVDERLSGLIGDQAGEGGACGELS